MSILVMAKPNTAIVDSLVQTQFDEVVCVNEDDVHIRFQSGDIITGGNIVLRLPLEIDVVSIKKEILIAYPLIDRWVSHKKSLSTSLGELLDYTISLIKIIGNYRPDFAILETGAPHHLWSYCLDIALRYHGVRTYYLYGNAIDSRCLIFDGHEKTAMVKLAGYDAGAVIGEYINSVKNNAKYIPADSISSISAFSHKSALFALYLHARNYLLRSKKQYFERSLNSNSTRVELKFPRIGFFQLSSILLAQIKYQKLITSPSLIQPNCIQSNDVVYVGHMLPEATSFPESPNFPDEVDVLVDLKNRFPNSKIFYREHPAINIFSEFGHVHYQGLHKCPAFYELLKALDIGIISANSHISELRERCCLFATKTGRVALENSILGVQTIIYGNPFYGHEVPLTIPVLTLPSITSVEFIRSKFAEHTSGERGIKDSLVERFSGSIVNPGISVGVEDASRVNFNVDFLKLVTHLKSINDVQKVDSAPASL